MHRFLIFLVLLWSVMPLTAQDASTETYIQPGQFAVDYPSGWQVEADDTTGFVYLRQAGVQMTFYSPEVLADYALDNYNPQTLLRLIAAVNDIESGDEGSLPGDSDSAYFLRYVSPATSNAGMLVVRTLADGAVALVDVFGPQAEIETEEPVVLQMIGTLERPPVPAPATLTQYGAPWPQAVDELESSGLIPSGGELVFAEPYVFAAGVSRTQPLAGWLDFADVVVAGSLQLTPGANPAGDSCGMLARLSESEGLEIGLDIDGNLYTAGAGGKSVLASGLDASIPHRVLLVALGERLLVYLDGALVANQTVAGGSGAFGVHVQGSGSGATCGVTEMWAYRVPSATGGVCTITASGGAVNRRSGPDVSFDVAGVLDDGASMTAQALFTGADGLVWWQLADGSWVREDVVAEQGACRALPAGE